MQRGERMVGGSEASILLSALKPFQHVPHLGISLCFKGEAAHGGSPSSTSHSQSLARVRQVGRLKMRPDGPGDLLTL